MLFMYLTSKFECLLKQDLIRVTESLILDELDASF
jgi:hypothetical protein